MANLICKKEFRCTKEEAEYIAACAERLQMTESNYMRYRLQEDRQVRLPPEINTVLKELKYYDLKIGTNINQIVRSCNTKRFITREDYRMLVEYLLQIDRKYQETLAYLREVLGNGNHKTAED